jgi:hypothetical protein
MIGMWTVRHDRVGPAGIALGHRTSHRDPQVRERSRHRRGPQIVIARLNNKGIRLYDSMQVPNYPIPVA